MSGANDRRYTDRLERSDRSRWKRLLGVQIPYRMHIRRVVETPVLDIGCGIGRNLVHLDGNGVGVDTNEHSVEAARERGLTVHTADEFPSSDAALDGSFSTLLLAHVLEHMSPDDATELLGTYLRYLRKDGRVVAIVPQEAGYASDPTHVAFVDRPELEHIASSNHLVVERLYSFPFPRRAGKVFRHNETVALLTRA